MQSTGHQLGSTGKEVTTEKILFTGIKYPVTAGQSPAANIKYPVMVAKACHNQADTEDRSRGAETEESLTLMSWNIAGLAKKIGDVKWWEIVNKFSIICLQETWSATPIPLNGYTTFF